MLKKLLAAVASVALAVGLVALVAAPASAHGHTVTADCTSVQVTLNNYQPENKVTDPNHVTVWIDGQVTPVTDLAFTAGFTKSYTLSTGKATHSYRVKVFAWDDPNGTSNYSFDTGVKTVTGCETTITPALAKQVDAVCTGVGTVGGGGYVIPSDQTGVEYQLYNPASSSWTKISAGTYAASVGAVIKLQAVATPGYKLDKVYVWTFTIAGPVGPTCVVPVAPTAIYAVCSATPGVAKPASYTIPQAPVGYSYYLNGGTIPLVAGAVIVSTFPTTVVIDARVNPGYAVPVKTTVSWTFSFVSAGECVADSVVVMPTVEHAACTATPGVSSDNYYTIYATTGAHFQVKVGSGAFVDQLPGRYDLGQNAVSITILALPDPHFQIAGQTSFPFDFAAADACLTTVIPEASSTVAVCDTAHPGQEISGSYTLDDVTGVLYSVSTDGGQSYAPVAAGTHQVANGTVIDVKAAGDTAHGYRVDGSPTWHFTFASPGDCLVKATAGPATFVNAVCDVEHPGTSFSGTYTIASAAHVTYKVSVSSIDGGAYKTAVTDTAVSTQPGDIVTILVVPDSGYKIDPPIVAADYTHTYPTADLCLSTVTAVKPAFVSQVCVPSGDGGDSGQLGGSSDVLHDAFITIPNTVGVQYFINGKAANAGDVILAPGTYVVTAAAKTGYTLDSSYPTDGWSETLTSAEPCGQLITHPLVDPTATQVQLSCFAAGSYTLGNNLNDPAAITWTVDGSTVAPGTYQVSTAGVVKIHAEANGPDYGLEAGATQDWTFSYATPTTCDLKTLALTGTTPVGWLALGYLMLVSGLALLAVRVIRRRGEQG